MTREIVKDEVEDVEDDFDDYDGQGKENAMQVDMN